MQKYQIALRETVITKKKHAVKILKKPLDICFSLFKGKVVTLLCF
jgi:hypothetical protein